MTQNMEEWKTKQSYFDSLEFWIDEKKRMSFVARAHECAVATTQIKKPHKVHATKRLMVTVRLSNETSSVALWATQHAHYFFVFVR